MKKQYTKRLWQEWFRWGLLAILLLAAGFLWYAEGRQDQQPSSIPTVTAQPPPQHSDRSKRETAYDRDIAALQALLDSGAADPATQELAARKLTELITEHQHEISLENALLEAGYKNAFVIMQNGAITVMVPESMLNESSSMQLLTLCVVHAGVDAKNVRIMGLK